MTKGIATGPGNTFRRARLQRFLQLADTVEVPAGRSLRILDIGGTRDYWESMADLWGGRAVAITLVNLDAEPLDEPPFHVRSGDACELAFADNSFDIVHSNSVIEHVGRWSDMAAMADEVRRLAPCYYLQTPNFWFPFEPHYRTLFFQWYPEVVRARMLMRRRRGFRGPAPSLDAAMRDIQTVNLLNAGQLAALFPDARIERERFAGLTKSIIAVRERSNAEALKATHVGSSVRATSRDV